MSGRTDYQELRDRFIREMEKYLIHHWDNPEATWPRMPLDLPGQPHDLIAIVSSGPGSRTSTTWPGPSGGGAGPGIRLHLGLHAGEAEVILGDALRQGLHNNKYILLC
jgi:hypothetical protein